MKKIIIMALCTVLLLCGCAKIKDADGIKVAEEAFAAMAWQDEVAEMDADLLETIYAIKGEGMDFKVWLGSGATAEEMAVFVCESDADADVAEQAAKTRIEEQKTGFTGYIPTEIPKLESAKILRLGNTIFLIVGDDTKPAEDIIAKAYGK